VYHFGAYEEPTVQRVAAAIALSALLPLAGCAPPYGYSPGAWAYYDDDYDYGHDGYDRPITYYGEAAYDRPYGNAYAEQPYDSGYYSQFYYGLPPAGASYGAPRARSSHHSPRARNSSWYSTYYSIGP
jgi:hypothetical protein